MADQNLGSVLTLSAAAAGTLNSPDQTSPSHHGANIFINVSVFTGAPSMVVTVQGKDEVSGQYYTLLATAAITTTGFTALRIFPGATNAANSMANDVLPRVWRIQAVITGGTSPAVTATCAALLTKQD